jgi:hypothetical protein
MANADTSTDGKLDLVPMIDCIMLLLLFFILTTSFTTQEKVIGSLLPTTQGDVAIGKVEPPTTISVCIYPAGFTRGYTAEDYQHQLAARGGEVMTGKAWLRIGNREPLAIDGALLRVDLHAGQAMPVNPEVERIDAYVASALNDYEKTGARKDQDPVSIASFSGMSWKFALVAYDAVRAYESGKAGKPASAKAEDAVALTPEDLAAAREVDFLPPPLRAYSPRELGEELADILRK